MKEISRSVKIWEGFAVVAFILLFISQLTWYLPSGPGRDGSMEVLSVVRGSDEVTIRFSLEVNLASNVTVVAIPVTNSPEIPPVYVFYDEEYTTRGLGSRWDTTLRLWEHIQIRLALRGHSPPIRLVDAVELEEIFLSRSRAVVVVDYGALPSTVFSWERDLVSPWLESGGVLFWFGWPPGFYTVERGQERVKAGMANNLLWTGVERLGLGGYYERSGHRPQIATTNSYLSEALEVVYDDVSSAPYVSSVIGEGGLILGKIGESGESAKVAVSALTRGMGKLVLFGFFTETRPAWVPTDWRSAARDISQILSSGILETLPGSKIPFANHRLPYGGRVTDEFTVSITARISGVVLYGFSAKNSDGLLYSQEFIWV